jgi:hypothetical protein
MARDEKTSPRIAAIAARGVSRPETLTPPEIRAVCASVLSQAPDKPRGVIARMLGIGGA